MRSLLLGCAVAWTTIVVAEPVHAQKMKAVRSAHLIEMGRTAAEVKSPGSAPSTDSLAEPFGSVEPTDSVPAAAFQIHDLSRRWVQFEMANSFVSASPVQTGAIVGANPVAPAGGAGLVSSPMPSFLPPLAVVIPTWMHRGVSFSTAATSFVPGCLASAYRPSGFLAADTESRRLAYYAMMSNIACEYGLPVGLFDAMIIRESGYKADAFSPKNAFGLTQLMATTAAGLGVDRYDIEQNLRGGARYLRQQLDSFGQVHLALAAYNAGPGRVRGGAVPRLAETQAYVDSVLTNWRRLAGLPSAGTIRVASSPEPQMRTQVGRAATVVSF